MEHPDKQSSKEATPQKEHGPYCKSFDEPDETRAFAGHGHLDLVSLEGGVTIGRALFEPGWRWSQDVKPLAGARSCEVIHTGYCVEGTMVVRMDDGEEFRLEPGSAFHIPAGHDAWVEGSKSCVLIDTAFGEYAKPKARPS